MIIIRLLSTRDDHDGIYHGANDTNVSIDTGLQGFDGQAHKPTGYIFMGSIAVEYCVVNFTSLNPSVLFDDFVDYPSINVTLSKQFNETDEAAPATLLNYLTLE